MKTFKPTHWWFGLIVLFSTAMLLFMYWETIQRYELKHAVNEGTKWTHMKPAGEISAGFKLRQSITHEYTDLRDTEWENPVCLDIQFVNYMNRRNEGNFSVTLTTGSATETRSLKAKFIRDNALHLVCYDSITFDQIYRKDAWIEVAGIDSPPKRSVSVTLGLPAGGARAEVNGQESDATLVYNAYIRKDPEWYQINSLVLIAFAAVMMALLLFIPQLRHRV